jgi:hypothetical protein
MNRMEYPTWLEYPEALAELRLRRGRGKDEIAFLCNPQGLASVAAVLLWLSHFTDPSGVSITALPFVSAAGALALSVVMTNDEQGQQGRLVKVDKDREFEWQIHYHELRRVAAQLYAAATHFDQVGHVAVRLKDNSDASLVFENTNPRKPSDQLAT